MEVGQLDRRYFLRATASFALAATALGFFADDARAAGASEAEHRYPIPATDGVTIDRSRQVIVVRAQNHAYAFALSCPHQNNAVKWVGKEQRFQCTKHDSQYQPDGRYTTGHATRNLDRYEVRRDGDSLIVNLSRWFKSDADPNGWAAATVTL